MACCTCRSMVTGDASARGLIQRPSRFSSPLTLESPMRPDVLAEMPTPAGRRIVVSLRARLHLELTRGHTDLDAGTRRRTAFDGMVLVDDRTNRPARTAGDRPADRTEQQAGLHKVREANVRHSHALPLGAVND